MASAIRIGDIGTSFEITIKNQDGTVVDVSGVSTKRIDFEKADGSALQATASFKTDGTDGIITYAVVSGDLNLAGNWKLQAYIVLSGGNTFYSDISRFLVEENL